jgi:putative tricarboxylic transport membrane protein
MTDKAIVVCALLLAAGYAWMTEQVTTLQFGDPLGPKAFPRILTAALIVAVALLLGEMALSKPASKAMAAPNLDNAAQDAPAVPSATRNTGWVVAATVAFTGLYFVSFEPLGFVLSSSVYLLAMTMCFNPGKTVANVLVSLLFPITCYLIFNRVLGVELARGILPL